MAYGRKTPAYDKVLGIPPTMRNPLLTQLLRSPNHRTLFVRKLSYQMFQEAKLFYEDVMHENLYH